ncbi:PF12873 domain protein [Slackia sp. CM382]|uniref:DUF3825 domain-containing protein n=1 Tax=Slackia sp. CM382 TaxID=1111137 RepID=UPI00027C4CFE|nr:DUF3825 domain-containing protein [Slackia sp. CM382]EJU33400.1 PF12873 domain protein [Slackia sp. CM382]
MPSKNTQPPTLSFEDAQHIYRILTKSFTFEEEYPLANLGWCFVREGIDKESYGFIKLRTMLAELEFVTLSSREISGEFQSTFILHEAPGYALDAPEGASGEPGRADTADAADGAAETGSSRLDAPGGAGSEDADGSEAADDSATDAQGSDEAPATEAAAKASSEIAAAEEPAPSVEAQAEPEAEPAEKAPKKPARARATRSRKKKEEPAADEVEAPSASAASASDAASASSATPADSYAEGADAKSAPAEEAEKDASDETSAPAKPARARATRTTKAAKTTRTRKTAKKAEAEKPAASDDAEEHANPGSDAASTAAPDGATAPVADAVAEVSSESEAASAAAADADAAAEPASAPVKKTRRTTRKKAAPKTKAADAEPAEAAEAAPSQADASISDTEAIDTEAEAEKKPARTRTTRRRTSTKMKTETESDDAADGAEGASASEAAAPSSEKSAASSETPEAPVASGKSASAPAETVEVPAPDASSSSESAPESASEATPEAAPAPSSSRRGRRGGRGRGRGRGDAERKEDASADQGAEISEQSGDAKPAAGRTSSRTRGRQQKSVAASDVLRSTIRRNRRYAPARVFERFAYLGHWKDFLKSLAAIALPEPWDFNGDADAAPRRYTILSNYIRYTFYRLTLEDKIGYSSDETFCAFNTGLVDTHYDDIYACFERNEKTEAFQPWSFTSFCTAGTGRYGKQLVRELNPLPQPASYLSRKEDLLFDLDRQIVCDIEHIVIDNIHRLPLEFLRDELASSKECMAVLADIESAPDAEAEAEAYDSLRTIISTKSRLFSRLSNSVNAAIDIARRQVRWNYKTAVPAYYPRTNNMNLLLPLNLTEDNIPDVALVVELQKSGNYQGQTIITMVQAYRDARLVCRPYIDWLSPATIVDEMDDDDDDDGQDPEGETEA